MKPSQPSEMQFSMNNLELELDESLEQDRIILKCGKRAFDQLSAKATECVRQNKNNLN